MPHPTGPTDPNTMATIVAFKKKKEKFYLRLARHLAKPARSKSAVNVTKIQRSAMQHEAVAVPGRVLGAGSINKPVTVYALHFSKAARAKITKAGGKCEHLTAVDKKARLLI